MFYHEPAAVSQQTEIRNASFIQFFIVGVRKEILYHISPFISTVLVNVNIVLPAYVLGRYNS